jgi:PAS domain S-box-containing protein
VDLLTLLIELVFFVLFAATLWRFARRPGPIELAVLSVFASTGSLFLLAIVTPYAPPEISAVLRPLALIALLIQPFFIVRLIDVISPLPRAALLLAFGAFVLTTTAYLVQGNRNIAAILLVVAYFGVGEALAAVQFFRLARRRLGLARIRLILAGVATLLFGLTIVIAGSASAASNGAGSGAATPISRLLALLAAIGYLAAFVPPRWLTGLVHRAVAFDQTRSIVASGAGTDPAVVWHRLELAAQTILGARTVEVLDGDGQRIAAVPTEGGEQPVVSEGGGRLGETVITLPLAAGGETVILSAHLEGRPLFVEDDLAVLGLLGSLAARAVAHERAMERLREAVVDLQQSAAVRASEARFRALLEAHPNAVLATDKDGAISWTTDSTAQLFGYPEHDVIGRPLTDLVDLHSVDRLGQRPDDGTVRRIETVAHRADGTTFPAEVALKPFELEGQPSQLALISDVTWRHDANEIRDRFIGILSHELRTPITSIYGGAQVLAKRAMELDPVTRDDLLHGLAAESERLQRMIENLLILARVERGADFFGMRPVLVGRVLQDVVEREKALWPSATINLSVNGFLPVVSADEDHLSQIMRNLLANAVKYAGAEATVDVEVRYRDPWVEVIVRDDGPGFPPEEADQLFGLYFRSARTTAAPGAGIGLFVCRQLVEAMGGKMWGRSGPEGHAEFGFTLAPYVDEEWPEPTKKSAATLVAAD